MRFTLNKKHKSGATSRPALSGGFAHEMATDPFLDWVLILILGLIAALILVGVGVSVYLGTRAELAAPGPALTKNAPLPLDEAALDNALAAFDHDAADKEAVIKGFNAPKDPSLP